MIKFDKYTKEIKQEVFLKTGYRLSSNTINRFLRFFLYNLSYEIKDLKVIKLPGFILKPSRKTVNDYLRVFPDQDILKPSKYFKLKEVKKMRKRLRQIKHGL